MTEERLSLYANSKLLHFNLPWVNRINLLKFRAATLKPKNCFVFSFPLTGILSTVYLFLRMDGTVSTPLRIRPMNVRISSSISSIDSRIRLLDLNGISRLIPIAELGRLFRFFCYSDIYYMTVICRHLLQ